LITGYKVKQHQCRPYFYFSTKNSKESFELIVNVI
jgi:hypothetical protein